MTDELIRKLKFVYYG